MRKTTLNWMCRETGSQQRLRKNLLTGAVGGEEAGGRVLDISSLLMAFEGEPFWILGVMNALIRDWHRNLQRWAMFLMS